MAFPTKEIWVIRCHTGCTYCSNENFTEGPYLTEEDAIKIKLGYEAGHGNPLASQYAKYGTYSIDKWEVEILPDGRWIHESNVFKEGFHVRELLDSDGAVKDF